MPGHKGLLPLEALLASDVTEHDGLDDLTFPADAILRLEDGIAACRGSACSMLSLGGASHGLIASVLSLSTKGRYLLVARDAHRAVINGLTLAGLDLVWLEPEWDRNWHLWAGVSPESLATTLEKNGPDSCAGVVVVSPTPAGAISNIKELSQVCQRFNVPLIVDEAHGAHLGFGHLPLSACLQGADLVVHSFHKTLNGLTQTGVLNLINERHVSALEVRACLRMITTSSPSYPLMLSIEQAHNLISSTIGLGIIDKLATRMERVRERITAIGFEAFEAPFSNDPFHLLIRPPNGEAAVLFRYLMKRGIVAESTVGAGCLLLAGVGTTDDDLDKLVASLAEFDLEESCGAEQIVEPPESQRQVLSPRQAFLMPSEVVPIEKAVGRVAAECIAPCPPGIPVCVPGAVITGEVTKAKAVTKNVRVVSDEDDIKGFGTRDYTENANVQDA